jgi:hypothetical protein
MTMPMLTVGDMLTMNDGWDGLRDAVSPFAALAKRIEVDTHPDGVAVDIIMSDGAPQTFRVVSVTPASRVTVGLKLPVVEVKPPWISNAR